jgi:hypothetical protein
LGNIAALFACVHLFRILESRLKLIGQLRILGITVLLASLAGCSGLNLRGDNFHDDMAHWGEKNRTADSPGEGSSDLLGVSEQARQVERNLGVR